MSDITWVSANTLLEQQTKKIAQEFHASNPKPRNKAMGFTGDDRPRKQRKTK